MAASTTSASQSRRSSSSTPSRPGSAPSHGVRQRRRSTSEVQVFVGKGITSIADLKGKRIGSPTLTGNINTATKAWLAANGVNPSSVQFVQVPTPNMTDELKAGQINAAELIYPFISSAKADGLQSLGDPEH